jgi:hypothetical protein
LRLYVLVATCPSVAPHSFASRNTNNDTENARFCRTLSESIRRRQKSIHTFDRLSTLTMRLFLATSLALALACELTSAKALLHASGRLHRKSESLEEQARREAFEFIDTELRPRRELSPRSAQATSTSSSSTSSGPPANLNDPTTNMTIAMACVDAFADITNVSNAAGWAACYNVLYLNNQTGIFEADLRLYQVSQPSGPFAGIPNTNIHLALNYPEAAISATSQQTKRSELATRQTNSNMSQLQQYSFVGQIDRRLTLTQLKA